MPIQLDLQENGRVLYVKVTDPFTAQDFNTSIKEQLPYYDNATNVLHQLINFSQVKKLPRNILAISNSIPAVVHPNRGHLVVIGANPFMQTMGEIIRVMSVNVIKFVATDEEALDYIHKVIARESPKT